MSFIWVSVYYFFISELLTCSLLLIPTFSNKINNIYQHLSKYQYFTWIKVTLTLVLSLLFIDSVRQIHHYRSIPIENDSKWTTCNTVLKTYKMERNAYLSGISLFLLFVMRRLLILGKTIIKKLD